jgi:GNAT superfamily N-acetyltransferase
VSGLPEQTREVIAQHWAAFLGCDAAIFEQSIKLVVPHVEGDEYWGIFIFVRSKALVVSMPPSLLEELHPKLEDWMANNALEPARLQALAGDLLTEIIGPAFIGYADCTTFKDSPSAARLLTVIDSGDLERFKKACSERDWEHGGSELGETPVVGLYDQGELRAIAGYEVWNNSIAHISVITHPIRRGKGYGKQVVSKIAQIALEQGLVAQYRTLHSNTPSIAVAESLGFLPYANSVALRLKARE